MKMYENWISSHMFGTFARDYAMIRHMLETYDISDIDYIISWSEGLYEDILNLDYEGEDWEYQEILSNLIEAQELAFTCEMRELATRW